MKHILFAQEEPEKGRGKKGKRRVVVRTSIPGIFFEILEQGERRSSWNNAAFEINCCHEDSTCVFGYRADHIGNCNHVAEGMRIVQQFLDDHPDLGDEEKKAKYQVAYLPAGDNKDFYPTPSTLAGKMLAKVDWKKVNTILEPSAGKGDLVDAVIRFSQSSRNELYNRSEGVSRMFDVIEMDMNLRLLLRGRDLRLVHDDFLTYHPQKRYDLLLMNPPFSEGAKHLLHAIELQRNGGQIVCLLNAETIRNPYTKDRQLLKQKLAEVNASIEFIQGAFRHAERPSDVEVALINIKIPARKTKSDIFSKLEKDQENYEFSETVAGQQLVIADELKALIQHYDFEARLGIKLMEEYAALAPNIMDSDGRYAKPLIQLNINDRSYSSISNAVVNQYLCNLRDKYWHLLLEQPSISSKMTSQMSSDYYNKVREMRDYPFTYHNIMQVIYDIQTQLQQGVIDSVMELFDKFTEHHYYPECEQNIHYFNGWTTNKAHKVGKKVILPLRGYSSYAWRKNELDSRYVDGIFTDLDRALSFLDRGETTAQSTYIHVLDSANANGTNSIDCTFFSAKFYKKGTTHITFHEDAMPLIERLNIFAARQRGWLPPCYGRKSYEDMDDRERDVIDSFQGKDEYAKVMAKPSDYILEAAMMQPLLTA